MNTFHYTSASRCFRAAALVTAGLIAAPAAGQPNVDPAADEPGQVLVTVRLIQVDFERLQAIESATGESMAPPEDWGVTFGIRIGADGIRWKPPIFYLGDEGEVRIGDQTWRLGAALEGEPADDDAAPFTVLSAPSLICAADQATTLTIGEPTPYLVLGPDGALRLDDGEAEIEGVTIAVTPTIEDSGMIEISPIVVDLRRLAGREPIPGVPFDVGRPIFETHSSSRTIRLAADDVAVMPMSQIDADDNDAIMLVISARAIDVAPSDEP